VLLALLVKVDDARFGPHVRLNRDDLSSVTTFPSGLVDSLGGNLDLLGASTADDNLALLRLFGRVVQ
jgi:hypothetical protein